MNLIEALRVVEDEFSKTGAIKSHTSITRYVAVMAAIAGRDGGRPISVIDLSRALGGESKPNITRTLDVLGDAGMVERHRHPADGRKVDVRLTRRGEVAIKRIEGAFRGAA
ncbi:MarR family transcriptional regulator [Falsiroseomonas sp. CW058]|uniref:MarR family transcriptional regulator n=1 Tax=Falsiroseomonas sp. CW058 TaxID=3388664 RepID=UPI003D31E0FA